MFQQLPIRKAPQGEEKPKATAIIFEVPRVSTEAGISTAWLYSQEGLRGPYHAIAQGHD